MDRNTIFVAKTRIFKNFFQSITGLGMGIVWNNKQNRNKQKNNFCKFDFHIFLNSQLSIVDGLLGLVHFTINPRKGFSDAFSPPLQRSSERATNSTNPKHLLVAILVYQMYQSLLPKAYLLVLYVEAIYY